MSETGENFQPGQCANTCIGAIELPKGTGFMGLLVKNGLLDTVRETLVSDFVVSKQIGLLKDWLFIECIDVVFAAGQYEDGKEVEDNGDVFHKAANQLMPKGGKSLEKVFASITIRIKQI